MTPIPRKLLGRNAYMMSREAVYETPDAVETVSREGYEISRKRVLFEEVLLVTIHRAIGALYVVFMALATLFFGGLALMFQFSMKVPSVAITFAVLAMPFFSAFLIRLILRVDFVTVFGRRSKAVMRFTFRKQRAREVYGRICARAVEAQRTMAERAPEKPPFIEQPPAPPAAV